MRKFYMVNNWYESFMIFTSLEKAKETVISLRLRCSDLVEEFDKRDVKKEIDLHKTYSSIEFYRDDKDWYKNYCILELQEGQGFGPELSTKDEYGFIIE